MRYHRVIIYPSWHKLAVTCLFIAVPVIYLLFFSQISQITINSLAQEIGRSLSRLFIAYLIGAVLAWIFAVLFYKGKRASVALPLFDVLQSFPTFAALPIAVIFFGRTDFNVILFLVTEIVWAVFFSIISSLKLVKKDWEDVVQIYNLKGKDYLFKFLVPISFTGLITGSIIGLGDAWQALVAIEIIVGVKSGVGDFFQLYSTNPTITIFGIFGLLLIIFSINKLVWLSLLDWSHKKMEE